jgi:hypothetical protein
MRLFILAAGMAAALAGAWMAWEAGQRTQGMESAARRLADDVRGLEKTLSALKALPQNEAQPLAAAYARVLNDMNVLARAHRLALVIEVEGIKGADLVSALRPSRLEGLGEIGLRIVFTGVERQGTVLSLLDGLSAVEAVQPVMITRVHYTGEKLEVAMAVLGL